MRSAEIAVRFPPDRLHPMHAFVCESPAVKREVLLEGGVVDGIRRLLFYVEGDAEAYEAAMGERLDADDYDIYDADDQGFYLYVRGPNRPEEAQLFGAFTHETVMMVFPIEFRPDRTMRLRLVGPQSDIGDVVEALPSSLSVELLSLGAYAPDGASRLTDRQRAALTAAWEEGYYEVPRENGIEAVAGRLDCSVSTASVLLRHAEQALVRSAIAPREPAESATLG